jgi:hypothetical protein
MTKLIRCTTGSTTGAMLGALVAFVLVLVLAPGRAEARRYYGGSVDGAPGTRTFGIGIMVLQPTALSMELKLSGSSGLDFAVGFNNFDEHDGGYFHFDYLVYLADLSRGGSVAVPFYLGIGLALWDYDDRFDNNDNLDGGLRIPFGLAISFRSAPVKFFGELALRFQFIDENDNNDNFDLTGAIGFRVYF